MSPDGLVAVAVDGSPITPTRPPAPTKRVPLLPLSVQTVAWSSTRAGLTAAARLGFRSAEVRASGLWANDVADVAAWLDEGNLRLSAVYLDLPDDPAGAGVAAARAADSALRFGARRLVVTANGDDFGQAVAAIAAAGAAAAAAGVRLCLHPHQGTAVEAAAQAAAVLEATDPAEVWVCVDTGHLLAVGDDPAAALTAWSARLAAIHLKDIDSAGRPVAAGSGRLNLTEAVGAVQAAVAAGAPVEHLTLEYKGSHPEAALVASLAAVSRARRALDGQVLRGVVSERMPGA